MIKIGEFSRLSNITIRMLRHYDKIGLLTPDYTDENTKYRNYSAKQLHTANKIQVYKNLGFSLLVIKEILSSENDKVAVETYFKIRQTELIEEKEALSNQINTFNKAYERMSIDMKTLKYNVILKTIPARDVISIRKVVKNYSEESLLWAELYQIIEKDEVKTLADGYAMTVYHDDEYKEEDIEIEVQVSVEGNYKDTEAINFYKTDEIQVSSITFNGSYDQMPVVAQAVGDWLEVNAYEINGPMINIFHVSPAQSDNQDDWVTEACYAVKKRD